MSIIMINIEMKMIFMQPNMYLQKVGVSILREMFGGAGSVLGGDGLRRSSSSIVMKQIEEEERLQSF
jgi:hypothetical protein